MTKSSKSAKNSRESKASQGRSIGGAGRPRRVAAHADATRRTQRAHKRDGNAPRPFSIVGIGASAGGLEAVTELLEHLPPNPGMALVVMQHLAPTHESALPTLLGRVTQLPVLEARNNLAIQPNQVYVIPPNKAIRVADRRLKVTPRNSEKDQHMPIDEFLTSLAEQEADQAIGVILSGNGSDGTRGLLAIKAAGGVTFGQDDRTAKYTAMPASAVAAGCVDFILSPAKIAQELVSLVGRPAGAEVPLVPATSGARGEERAFEEIIAVLRRRVGVDFTHYKRPTLDRRIRRRVGLRRLHTLRQYADHLRTHPPEVQELFDDILIHVTGFFRDKSVFASFKKKILPRLVKGRASDETIRIWVPGCSSGEEVYSLAMTVVEFLAENKLHFPVQLFGTDINLKALDRARGGYYPGGIAADVSADRLRRFFIKSDSGFRISKTIREMCIFARQNLAVDPPFSNLDLISCRNVLIYLGPPLQRKVFPVFHYALRTGGFLLLGASETTGSFVELFTLTDRRAKFYAKRATINRPPVTFGHGSDVPETDIPARVVHNPAPQPVPITPDIQKHADMLVLAHYSPPGVVINRQMDVLQFRGRTSPYLEHSHGEATLSLLKLAREGLLLDLRAAINQAIKQKTRVRQENIRVRQNGDFGYVNVEVLPFSVPPSSETFYLVSFESMPEKETAGGKSSRDTQGKKQPQRSESREMSRMREELGATRESLQSIIGEQEATNEELRSANEEIMSSNEELQSTNEELETAKEELQSTNEELTTLNDELESRNGELEKINNDLHNLMGSVNIPIVIVGPDLRIRRFTNVAEKLLNLIPGDVGRPITDIKMRLEVPRLEKLIYEVIETLEIKDFELRDHQGHWWSVRIRPYKTTDQKIDGAVVAFVDVEQLKNPHGPPL